MADYWEQIEAAEFEISVQARGKNMRGGMEKPEPITLETVLALARQLSAAGKLQLVEQLLVELEPIVERKEPKKWKSSSGTSEGQSLTEEEVEEIKRKL